MFTYVKIIKYILCVNIFTGKYLFKVLHKKWNQQLCKQFRIELIK